MKNPADRARQSDSGRICSLPFQYTTERMKCMNVIFCMSVIRDDDGEIRIRTSGAVSQEKMAPFLISIVSRMMDDEAKSAQKMRAILADAGDSGGLLQG